MVEHRQHVETDGRVDVAAAPVEHAAVRPATLADRLLDGAGNAILAHDHHGVVRFLNTAARVLLPDLRVGELLADAFDPERLAAVLAGCEVLPAPGIAERVVEHTTRWLATGHHDDIAVLVVQAPIPVPRRSGRHLRSVHPVDHEEVP